MEEKIWRHCEIRNLVPSEEFLKQYEKMKFIEEPSYAALARKARKLSRKAKMKFIEEPSYAALARKARKLSRKAKRKSK